ncbi:hypothetical protein Bca4012_036856 [Brassica carinata]
MVKISACRLLWSRQILVLTVGYNRSRSWSLAIFGSVVGSFYHVEEAVPKRSALSWFWCNGLGHGVDYR